MAEDKDYGLLINQDIKLHRMWFRQMVKLLGINCMYYAPLDGKTYDMHGDLDTNYYKPIKVGCIFEQHPDIKTLKKRGWVTELQESSSMIHVPYDLDHLQVGALFAIPSGIDDSKPRMFRVIAMQTGMIYPASIACEIAPEYIDNDQKSTFINFEKDNFTLLKDNEGDD